MKEAHRLIITNGKQVLLGLRNIGDVEGNKWHIMGGKAEEGETGQEAVRREIREETGLDFEPTELLFTDVFNDWITYYYIVYYDGEIGQEGLDGENQAVEWVEFKDVASLSLAFNHLDILLSLWERELSKDMKLNGQVED